MFRAMSELLRGARDFGRGLAFLNAHPRLWSWVIAPALVTALAMGALIALALRFIGRLTGAIVGWLPEWLQGVAGAGLTVVLGIALAAGAALIFVSIAGAIAGPFCELLSEEVEAKLTGQSGPPFALGRFLHELTVGLTHTLRRLLASLSSALLLLLLSFLPLAGAVAALVLGAWFSAQSAAYDCYDAVLARRAMPYRGKLAVLARHRGRSLGLGLTVTVLLLVPGVNLVVLGVGAVGATLAARDLGI